VNSHTPGPWRCELVTSGQWEVFGPTQAMICRLAKWTATTRSVDAADARLIAAAPELLDACRRLLKFNEELCADVNVSTHYPSAEFARKVIAKAEGR